MKILGVETSCDETAVCIIEATGEFGPDFQYTVLGNALHSQIATHAPWGGVFPNLAKREHAKNLVPLLVSCLQQSNMKIAAHKPANEIMIYHNKFDALLAREQNLLAELQTFLSTHNRPDLDAIAVTAGPGLEPALWVGVNFAKALSLAWDMPIIAVNHLEGHIAMALMNVGHPMSYMRSVEFPALALLISGGHTEIDLIKKWPEFEMIGQTRDDAVGEAFDKVARMLGIPYPGGAALSTLAAKARKNPENSSRGKSSLPRPMLNDETFDFSFSGLKTAVLRLISGRELDEAEKMAIALEFENAVAEVLAKKTARAAEEYGARMVLVGGGVSANDFLKQTLADSLAPLGVSLLAPPPEFSTDNALMIALAGYFHALKKELANPATLRADGNLKLSRTG